MIQFSPCACAPGQVARIHRSLWMRLLFPTRALYACSHCGKLFLATVADQTELGRRAQAERLQSGQTPVRNDSAAPSLAG